MKKLIFIILLLVIIGGCTTNKYDNQSNTYDNEQDTMTFFCQEDSDCKPMYKDCGDFNCVAQEVDCINSICCGSYYITQYDTLNKNQYESRLLKWLLDAKSIDLSSYNLNIESDFTRIECSYDTATRSKNFEDCENFEMDVKILCKNVINFETGYEEGDATYCNNIEKDSLFKDHCFSMVAKKNKDSIICDNVINDNQKNDCISFIFKSKSWESKDAKLCESIPIITSDDIYFQNSRNECFSDIAKYTGDIELCEKVSTTEKMIEGSKWNERDNCKKWAAVTAMNYEHCLTIDIADQKLRCLWFLAAEIAPVDLNQQCQKLLDGEFDEEKCYNELINICNLLDKSSDRCVEEVDRTFKIYREQIK